jgi:hypothetical protein
MNFANFALNVKEIVSEMTLSEACSLVVEFTSFDKSLDVGEIRVDRANNKIYMNTSEGRGAEKEVAL